MPAEATLLRVLIIGRHWQRFETFAVQFARAAKNLAELQGEPNIARVTVSSRQFERWYAGKVKTVPHPDSSRVLEHMFGYPVAELLASADHIDRHTATRTEIRDNSPLTIPAPHELRADDRESSARWRLGEAGVTYLSEPERIVAMAARKSLRFSLMADASNISGESIDQLRHEVSRLAVAYLQMPIAEIIDDIATLQDITFELLLGRQRPRESQDLYAIGSIASGMLAKAAHDLRNPQLAMTHARTALLCAANSEQPALSAWVHGLQSLITFWADRPREALDFARIGQQIPDVEGTAATWLASLEARAWAALGNRDAAERAIHRAADLRDRVSPDELDNLGGMCFFSRPRQLYYAADARALLATPELPLRIAQDAAQSASDAIAAYKSASPAERSFGDEAGCRTDLAIARVSSGDLEGAREAISGVLELPAPQRIHGVVTSVVNVHHAVTRLSADTPVGRELQEEIEEYCRRPIAALPS
jgi:hypothetical protein